MLNSQKFWLIISGIMGFSGVALGAFGAHLLKAHITNDQLEIYKTGIMYHLIHAGVMFAIALYGHKKFYNAEIFFLAGIVLFSFTLYLYSITSAKIFAMVTPLGGVCFLLGWVLVILTASRSND